MDDVKYKIGEFEEMDGQTLTLLILFIIVLFFIIVVTCCCCIACCKADDALEKAKADKAKMDEINA